MLIIDSSFFSLTHHCLLYTNWLPKPLLLSKMAK